MKNFDDSRRARRLPEEQRTFQLHGEAFVLQAAVHPEALHDYDRITAETGVRETMEIVDTTILNMIEDRDDAHARYHAVRADKEDPITIDDLQELVEWMVSVQTARPTGQPGSSSSGQQRTTTPSKEASSSVVGVAV